MFLPSMDPKKVQTRPWFPTQRFYTLPGIYRRFRPKVLSQTPTNAFLDQRSHSKAPNHALEKVLTNETPCMCVCVVSARPSMDEAPSDQPLSLAEQIPLAHVRCLAHCNGIQLFSEFMEKQTTNNTSRLVWRRDQTRRT